MRGWTILAGAALLAVSPATMAQTAGEASMPGVKLYVADMQNTTAFYIALGMRAGIKYNDHESSLEWAAPTQGSRIIMVHDDSGKMSFPTGGAFLMISVPDMSAALGRLKAAGFSGFGTPMATPRAAILMLRDPDGNRIELLSAPAK
jgi:predicted enzyme related to lactoylglutathione lyase